MPSGSLSDSADNGVEVTVTYGEGVFYEGTVIRVTDAAEEEVLALAEQAAQDGLEVVDVLAVDVTFYYEDNEVQPQGELSVTLTTEREVEGDVHELLHVHDGEPEIIEEAEVTADEATFAIDTFSVFGIVGYDQYDPGVTPQARHTYEFYVDDKLIDTATQVVTDGDTLVEPPVPASEDGKLFRGWTITQVTYQDDSKESRDTPVTFGTVSIDAYDEEDVKTGDRTYRVEASFSKTYYVTFYQDKNKTTVLRTKAAESGATVSTTDVTYDLGNGQAITGWTYENGNAAGESVKVSDANIDLLPVISSVKWITFDAKGGTPVMPVYVETGKKAAEPAAPTRAGFTFTGWYTDEAAETRYDFESAVNEDITLYAGWKGDVKVPYTVVYWKENANDDKYTFAEMTTGQGYAGTAAAFEEKSYEGFRLNAEKSQEVVTIKGDGTTIKNVYYDRQTYPLTFYVYYKKGSKVETVYTQADADAYDTSIFNVTKKTSGRGKNLKTWWEITAKKTGWLQVATQSFKYQQDTSVFWNAVSKTFSGNLWYVSQADADRTTGNDEYTFYSAAPTMEPSGGSDLTGFQGISAYGKKGEGTSSIQYIEEQTNQKIRDDYTQESLGWKFSEEDYISIPGFTYANKKEEPTWNTDYWGSATSQKTPGRLYYTRNTYTLRFMTNGGADVKEGNAVTGIPYEASLSEYEPANYVTGETTKTENGITLTFDGWYDNEALAGDPFDFDGTMPALEVTVNADKTGDKSTLILYAKWTAGTHTVTFDLDGGTIGDQGTIAEQTVESGHQATQPAGDLKKEGFTFGGWQTANGALFSFDTLITEDINLTAKWYPVQSKETIRIVYAAGDEGTFDGEDDKKYLDGAEATVKGVPAVTEEAAAEGWYFKGWKVGESDVLVSGGTFTVSAANAVDGVLTLTAQYEHKAPQTIVRYHSNYPSALAKEQITKSATEPIDTNDNFTIPFADAQEIGIAAPGKDYTFVCWRNDRYEYFYAYDTAAAGRESDLYAMWRLTVTVNGKTQEVTYDGKTHTVEGFTLADEDTDALVSVEMKEGKTAAVSGKDAGPYEKELDADDFVATSKDPDSIKEVTVKAGSDITLTINPKDVYVKTEGAEKKYDGKPLTNPKAEIVGLVEGEKAEVTASGSRTEPGEVDNTYNDEDINWTTAKEGNYRLDRENDKLGKLKVTENNTQITVYITGGQYSAPYDGKPHTVSGYKVTKIDVAGNAEVSYTEKDVAFNESGDYDGDIDPGDGMPYITRTNVTTDGPEKMGLTKELFTNTNEYFTNVVFDVTDGSLEITTLDVIVEIIGNKDTGITYNGEEHTATGYTVGRIYIGDTNEDTKLFDPENDLKFDANGNPDVMIKTDADSNPVVSGTDAGTYDMGLEELNFENTNPNLFVVFDVTDGKVEIVPLAVTVTITGDNNTTTYDGKEHTVTGYDVTKIVKTDTKEETKLYTKERIVFTADADIKTDQEGNPTATQTEVGTATMGLKEEQFADNAADGNFDVTFDVTDGFQTINPVGKVTVTITGHKDTRTYNGKTHSVSGYDVKFSDPLYKEEYFEFTGTAQATGIEAGTYQMGLKKEQFVNKNERFTTVTFEIEDGSLTIDPVSDEITVYVQGTQVSAWYDGTTEHVARNFKMVDYHELYNANADVDFTPDDRVEMENGVPVARRTDVGTTYMGLEASQFTNTNKNFSNVTFKVKDGFVEVMSNEALTLTVDVSGADETAPYDGRYHYGNGVTVRDADGNEVKDATIWYYNSDAKEWTDTSRVGSRLMAAGTRTVRVKATKEGYQDSEEASFKITVQPREIVIKVNDKEVTYGVVPVFDASDYKVTMDGDTIDDPAAALPGIAGDQRIEPQITIGIPADKADAYENKGTYEDAIGVLDESGHALTGEEMSVRRYSNNTVHKPNYSITIEPGTLTVNPRPVYVKVNDASKTYGDEEPDISKGYTVAAYDPDENTGLLPGHSLDAVAAREKSDADPYDDYEDYWTTEMADTYPVTLSQVTVSDSNNGNNNAGLADNYEITVTDETFTINKKKLTITVGDATVSLADPGTAAFTYTADGLLDTPDAYGKKDEIQDGAYTYVIYDSPDALTPVTPAAAGTYYVGMTYTDQFIKRNPYVTNSYEIEIVRGTLTVTAPAVTPPGGGGGGGGTPPAGDDPVPDTPTPVTPVPADVPDVLGAVRTEGAAVADTPAVLGARRDSNTAAANARQGQTGEASIAYRWYTMFACLAAILLLNADRAVLAASDRRRARARARRRS